MIKIIKEGIKEFAATCPFCYCEFTYEKEDAYNGTISCPCCGTTIDVTRQSKPYTRPYKSNTPGVISEPVILDNMTWETPEYKELSKLIEEQMKTPSYVECNKPKSLCETCSYYLRLKSGEIFVGDSPCQWCQHSGLKVTCTSTGTSINEMK